MGQVRLDKNQRTVRFPAAVNQTNGAIEYLIVTSSGKTHESLLRTDAEPYHIQLAFLLLGAKGAGTNSFPENNSLPLPGEEVEIEGDDRRAGAPGRRDGSGSRRQPPPVPLPPSALAAELRLKEAGLEPPPDSEFDSADLAALRVAGQAVRVTRALHYHPEALSAAREALVALAQRNGGAVTLAQLRDELGTSRKFAQALLEHFDSEKLTLRRGDQHVLRRARAAR